MRTKAMRGACLGLVTAMGIGLSACSEYEPDRPREAGTTVIVSGHRSNMPFPVLVDDDMTYDIVHEAVSSGDAVYLVSVSGRPERENEERFGNEECNGPETCELAWSNSVAAIQNAMTGAVAKTEEADLLAAVNMAAGILDSADEDKPRHLVILDNGLSTAGQISFVEPEVFTIDPAMLASGIARDGGLIRLDGVKTVMSGVGSVYAPQERLSEPQLSHVRTFWESLLSELGGDEVRVGVFSFAERNEPADGLPHVSVVVPEAPSPRSPPPPEPPDEPVILREDQIGFLPDSAEFRDPERTRESLRAIAEQLVEFQVMVVLEGTTALPDVSGLSQRRANATKGVLVGLGVVEECITATGVGIDFEGYKDPGERGTSSWNEAIAIENRLVIMSPSKEKCPEAG